MSSGKLLKQRRKATKNIYKITKTMGLVATAKLKTSSRNYNQFLLYRDQAIQMLLKVMKGQPQHPLLNQHPLPQQITIFAIASNKGLCGSYNTRISDTALALRDKLLDQGKIVHFFMFGRKAIRHLQFKQIPLDEAYTKLKDQPSFQELEQIAERLMQDFQTMQTHEIHIVYMKKMRIVDEILLPLSLPPMTQHEQDEQYFYDPGPEDILMLLLPMCFKLNLYQKFLDAAISEQTSRMLAMKTASENAEKMIKVLTRQYNRARQTQITKEILEVLGGAEKK